MHCLGAVLTAADFLMMMKSKTADLAGERDEEKQGGGAIRGPASSLCVPTAAKASEVFL